MIYRNAAKTDPRQGERSGSRFGGISVWEDCGKKRERRFDGKVVLKNKCMIRGRYDILYDINILKSASIYG